MEIRKELAYKMAQALVEVYNSQYDDFAHSCRILSLRTLKKELDEVGFGFLIASAKGTLTERKEAFRK
jgi:hypothetical protein